MVPTFAMIRSVGSVPSCAPAASPRVRRRLSPWPLGRGSKPGIGVAHFEVSTRCCPTHVHQVWGRCLDLRGFDAGSLCTPFHLACRATAVWQCRPPRRRRGCSHPSRASGSGCPQLHQAAATSRWRSSFISARNQWRLVAHAPIQTNLNREGEPGLNAGIQETKNRMK
jgi:hypothetical protein